MAVSPPNKYNHTPIKLALLLILPGFFICCTFTVRENKEPSLTEFYSDTWKYAPGEGSGEQRESSDYDDSGWRDVSSLRTLRQQGLVTDNGYGWYRKEITVSDSIMAAVKRNGAAVLRLGKISAVDEVYVNGTSVGATGGFPSEYKGFFEDERNYLVPFNLLLSDTINLIAIKFYDGGRTGGFLDGARLRLSSAKTEDKILLDLTTDEELIFRDGKPLSVKVGVDNRNIWETRGYLHGWFTTPEGRIIRTDSIRMIFSSKDRQTATFELKDATPGFYDFSCQLIFNDGRRTRTETITLGYEPERIESSAILPEDFFEFWQGVLAELDRVPPKPTLESLGRDQEEEYELYRVVLPSIGGNTITAYYALPTAPGNFPVVIDYPDFEASSDIPSFRWDGFAHLSLYYRTNSKIPYGVTVPRSADPDRYYVKQLYADAVQAVRFAASREETEEGKIWVRGNGQGAAMAFAGAALSDGVDALVVTNPSMSDFRRFIASAGWLREEIDKNLPRGIGIKELIPMFDYYDISLFAPEIKCPVLMGIAIQNRINPPGIGYAAYNTIRSQKQIVVFSDYYDTVGQEFHDRADDFARDILDAR